MLGLDEMVAPDEAAVILDPAGELLELQLDEPTIVAELYDVALDLVGNAPHHLGPLEHRRDVAECDEIFDLERRERAGYPVETRLVATEDLQRLIGAREHAR